MKYHIDDSPISNEGLHRPTPQDWTSSCPFAKELDCVVIPINDTTNECWTLPGVGCKAVHIADQYKHPCNLCGS